MSKSRALESVPLEQVREEAPRRGLFVSIPHTTDLLLRERETVYGDIVQERDLARLCAVTLAMTFLYAGAYGATMGAKAGAMQAAAAAVKLPLLLILSLSAVTPPLYAFNALMGSRIKPAQLAALVCATSASTSVLLVTLAPVSLFLTYSGLGYSALKLAQVGLLFAAGYYGAYFAFEGVQTVAARTGREQSMPILQVWLLAYAYIGAQLGWMMRPFVGDPTAPFALVRGIEGSIFTGVIDAIVACFR